MQKTKYIKRNIITAIMLLVLVACGKTQLYGGLEEEHANEIIATLEANSITADKTVGKGNMVSVMIDNQDFSKAVSVLKLYGLPREVFLKPTDIYDKDKLVSSPAQERSLFLYSRGQELSHTLSKISGVITADVSIVVPEPSNLFIKQTKPSASVLIRCREGAALRKRVPEIKELVSHAVDGLEYDNVFVSIFSEKVGDKQDKMPSKTQKNPVVKRNKSSVGKTPSTKTVFGLQIGVNSVTRFRLLVAVGILTALFVGAGVGMVLRRNEK